MMCVAWRAFEWSVSRGRKVCVLLVSVFAVNFMTGASFVAVALGPVNVLLIPQFETYVQG
jgi:hypothetical protein